MYQFKFNPSFNRLGVQRFISELIKQSLKQDQDDLCRSPGFYFDLDFSLRKFQDLETFQLVVP